MTVNTSKRKGAGTDGSVFVTLHGSKGPAVTSATTNSSSSSGLLSARQQSQSPAALPVKPKAPDSPAGTSAAASGWLSSGRHGLRGSSRAAFEEGGVGSFMLPSMRSLGQLRQLTLELEGTTSVGLADVAVPTALRANASSRLPAVVSVELIPVAYVK